MKRVCVVVLGDIGRSPRMRYHAQSFAREGYFVDLVGYGGSKCPQSLLSNENIQIKHLSRTPEFAFLPSLLRYALKVIWQLCSMFFTLMMLQKPNIIFIQNPPSLPSLFVLWLVKSIRGCKSVIDWHNYGYSILSLKHSVEHPIVKFSKWFENYFGRKSDYNFCVTAAMREDLLCNWKLDNVRVLYDRPAEIYRPVGNVDEIHSIFKKLKEEYETFRGDSDENTAFTNLVNGEVCLREDRPALIISSTSWTEDEDFSILLSALQSYDLKKSQFKYLPSIVCIITGKGPLKEYYCKLFNEKKLKNVKFCMPWLSAEDYATLLGCCDLGISLHYSSSGVDLPMKVVDMFGCCLPVCAINFKCLNELVKDQQNGMIFNDENELTECLITVFADFPKKKKLDNFKNNLSRDRLQWHESWKNKVLPICSELVAQ